MENVRNMGTDTENPVSFTTIPILKAEKAGTSSGVDDVHSEGTLKQCENNRTISLIIHTGKVILRTIFNRLKSMAKELFGEEQTGFRAEFRAR
ncbi:hypothetical protein DPMN_140083 [Dreissena polymorpha]|uniref:Uncharacterized protein n=1 Tax=Dreissena polymorpha TaxID=45954 RepID=A0A9D4JGC1_DREPO|nr:hypothetical protein DPMN_140083 [Dreissena polymorpha]